MPSSGPATRCCARSRSGRARSCPARSTSTARRSGTWHGEPEPGRVLLTHLQMGYDRGATVDSVRARFDGGPVELVDPGFETSIGALNTTKAPHQG